MADIQRVNDHDFDWQVPVLIIGAGACGLTAALAAGETGAQVMVLEQDAQPSGSTGMSYGAICAAGTRLQAREGVNDQPEWLYEDILEVTRQKTNPALARTLASHSGPAVDWLASEHGLSLTVITAWTGLGHRQPRLHAPASRSGEHLVGMLLKAVEAMEIDVLTEARVTTLMVDEQDHICGVQFVRPDGSREELGCQTLILATCGFGDNPDWVDQYIPDMATARYYGHEGNRGDGIAWGQQLGAAVADMGSFQALGSLAHPQSLVIPHTLLIGGGVQVNQNGERFEDELDDISGQALTILEQPDRVCWIIYDQRLHKEAMEGFQEYREAEELNTAKRADSWDELELATGMPAGKLHATMQLVAERCRDGEIDEFGRRFSSALALKPPFFAIRVTGALFHTQGGLVVDEQARVLRQDGRALPNLFAGGGAACSVSGPGGWAYLPGMGLCTAVTLGRLAGQAAAQQALALSEQ